MPTAARKKTTTHSSWIGDTLKAMSHGLLLLIIAFLVIYWDEGQENVASVARTAVEIASDVPNTDASLAHQFVSTTGVVDSNASLGDGLFLQPGKFIALQRTVEMYSWMPTQNSDTQNWTENPVTSHLLKQPINHQNPNKILASLIKKISSANIGIYHFNLQDVILPTFYQLPLNPQMLSLPAGVMLANPHYLFISMNKNSTLEHPRIGDIRISYSVVPSGIQATLFGRLVGDNILKCTESGNRFYRLFLGARDHALSVFQYESGIRLWMFRIAGFLMMWFGLLLLFKPLNYLFSFFEIMNPLTRLLVGTVNFLVAALLTIATLALSTLVYSFILAIVIGLIVMIIAVCVLLMIIHERISQSLIKP